MFRLITLSLLSIACFSLPADAQCDGCDFMPYDYAIDCYDTGSECVASDGGYTVAEGTPDAPTIKNTCYCNQCGQEGPATETCGYTRTNGFQFCFTLGGSVTWGLGAKYELNASGQWCWSSQETLSTSVQFTCAAGEKKRARIYETRTPTTITQTLKMTKKIHHTVKIFPPSQCAGLSNFTVTGTCDDKLVTATSEQYSYSSPVETLDCPEEPEPLPEDEAPLEE